MTQMLPTCREIAWHESHHAASLIIDGLTPLVVRTDYPAADRAGLCKLDWENHNINDRNMRCLLVAALLGPISESEPIFTHTSWPICPAEWKDECRADARLILFVAGWLNLTLVDYLALVCAAGARAKDPLFRRLVVEIAGALERVEVVLQPELQALTDEVTR